MQAALQDARLRALPRQCSKRSPCVGCSLDAACCIAVGWAGACKLRCRTSACARCPGSAPHVRLVWVAASTLHVVLQLVGLEHASCVVGRSPAHGARAVLHSSCLCEAWAAASTLHVALQLVGLEHASCVVLRAPARVAQAVLHTFALCGLQPA